MAVVREAIAETYRDVERLIERDINRYCLLTGENREDVASVCNEYFMRAYYAHDEEKQDFPGYLSFRLRMGLRDKSGHEWRHRAGRMELKMDGDDNEVEPNEPVAREFDWRRFALERLSPDAGTVLRLIFDEDAPRAIVCTAFRRSKLPINMRRALRSYLLGMGWTIARINESFNEIRNAIR